MNDLGSMLSCTTKGAVSAGVARAVLLPVGSSRCSAAVSTDVVDTCYAIRWVEVVRYGVS